MCLIYLICIIIKARQLDERLRDLEERIRYIEEEVDFVRDIAQSG